jgi:hypothetical protein
MIEEFKKYIALDRILDNYSSEKTDEELIDEFKKENPDLELSDNQIIAVNNIH